MNISRYHSSDYSEFSLLDTQYFPYPWKQDHWNEVSQKPDEWWLWQAREANDLLGFLLIRNDIWNDNYHLVKILVKPESRQHGVADQMFETFLRQSPAKNVLLEVATTNTSAIHFYRKKNFVQLQEVRGFYSDGSNAFVMQRNS